MLGIYRPATLIKLIEILRLIIVKNNILIIDARTFYVRFVWLMYFNEITI